MIMGQIIEIKRGTTWAIDNVYCELRTDDINDKDRVIVILLTTGGRVSILKTDLHL